MYVLFITSIKFPIYEETEEIKLLVFIVSIGKWLPKLP
jgi:hypothetical protein